MKSGTTRSVMIRPASRGSAGVFQVGEDGGMSRAPEGFSYLIRDDGEVQISPWSVVGLREQPSVKACRRMDVEDADGLRRPVPEGVADARRDEDKGAGGRQ